MKQHNLLPGHPVWGCVLIGGKSRRMGTPKHLIEQDGYTWVERAVAALDKHVEQIVVSGAGELPDLMNHLQRVDDPPDLFGPIAGVLSVLRTWPNVSWLVVACDQPDIQPQALQWLLAQRQERVKAILPTLDGKGNVEPLLAYYDVSCKDDLENIARQGSMQINRLKDVIDVQCPRVPDSLKGCWRNVNTVAELRKVKRRS